MRELGEGKAISEEAVLDRLLRSGGAGDFGLDGFGEEGGVLRDVFEGPVEWC